jgi:hypothetical protein
LIFLNRFKIKYQKEILMRKNLKKTFGALEVLGERAVPAIITYPYAPSVVVFDPKGEREPDPGPLQQTPIYDFLLDPPLNIINMDTPIDTSSYC